MSLTFQDIVNSLNNLPEEQKNDIKPGKLIVIHQERVRARALEPHLWSRWSTCTEAEYLAIKENPMDVDFVSEARKFVVEITES